MNNTIKIEIPLLCRSKKNSQQIFKNRYTGKTFITQSELYKQFEKDCYYFLKDYIGMNIDYPINFKCEIIVPDRKKRDITNLLNAIQDILVKYNVLADDNYNIISSLDGSKIIYEKGVENIKIEITKI